MTNPLVMRPWQLERVTGAIRAVVDDMIAQGSIVIDYSKPLGNDGPEWENVSGPKPTAINGRRGLTHNRPESIGGL